MPLRVLAGLLLDKANKMLLDCERRRHLILAHRVERAGNFVLAATPDRPLQYFVTATSEQDIVLGDYLEVIYVGPCVQAALAVLPSGGNMRVPIYAFPLLIQHSLRHDDAQVRAVLWTASRLAANFSESKPDCWSCSPLTVGVLHANEACFILSSSRWAGADARSARPDYDFLW